VVFGRRAGRKVAELARKETWPSLSEKTVKRYVDPWNALLAAESGRRALDDSTFAIRRAMTTLMTNQVGVFRTGPELQDAVDQLQQLKERYQKLGAPIGRQPFNYALMDYLEVGYLLDLSEIIAQGAAARCESRGAHYRMDFPQRDDQNWLHHTFAKRGKKGPEFSAGPVTITSYEPQERGY